MTQDSCRNSIHNANFLHCKKWVKAKLKNSKVDHFPLNILQWIQDLQLNLKLELRHMATTNSKKRLANTIMYSGWQHNKLKIWLQFLRRRRDRSLSFDVFKSFIKTYIQIYIYITVILQVKWTENAVQNLFIKCTE